MGQLLAHDGHRNTDAKHDAFCEGRSDGQTIDEVVQAVPKDHHVCYWRHLAFMVVVVPMIAVAVRSSFHLHKVHQSVVGIDLLEQSKESGCIMNQSKKKVSKDNFSITHLVRTV